MLQRVTGLLLVAFLIAHTLSVHYFRQGTLDSEFVRSRLAGNWVLEVFYGSFIVCVVYHAFNGLWGIILDGGPDGRARLAWAAALWAAGVGTSVFAFYVLSALLAL